MKQLFIIRHAKSSWDISVLNDFDRALNERGHRDAPIMAKKLLDKNIAVDLFVSSTAKRAFKTATYFTEAYHKQEKDILKVDELYHAMPDVFYKTIVSLNDDYNNVALFAHNPGITEFVNELTKTQIDDMPTCGIFAIKVDSKTWSNFGKAKKEFWFFDYPKAI
jgi:phosphohistidine phosphatase